MISQALKQLENDLWAAADKLRANSDLKSSEYATPVLGLIFLKFADNNYRRHETAIHAEYAKLKGTRREKKISDIAIEKCGFYLPDHARYEHLLNLPEEKNIARALKEAMKAIEEYKPELEGVLPKDEYAALTRTDKTLPKQLLRAFADIPADTTGDLFGQIYEYFLSEFARSEGQKGGEFFTPRSLVCLMAEIIEPHGGKVFDPACGSGGMFVQSAQFIAEHRKELKGLECGLYVCGQEKTRDTGHLPDEPRGQRCRQISRPIPIRSPVPEFRRIRLRPRQSPVQRGRRELLQRGEGQALQHLRHPAQQVESEEGRRRQGNRPQRQLPVDQPVRHLAQAARPRRAGDGEFGLRSGHSDVDIRKALIAQNLIYAMLTLPSNMFYTVTLPATLWFFDKAKTDDKILFIDARNIFTQIDRAHREFSEEHIQNIAIISQLHKGRREKFVKVIDRYFAAGMERLAGNKMKVNASRTNGGAGRRRRQTGGGRVGAVVGRLAKLQTLYAQYQGKHADERAVDMKNEAQQQLREAFDPFFVALHEGLKHLDKVVRQHERQQANRRGRRQEQ